MYPPARRRTRPRSPTPKGPLHRPEQRPGYALRLVQAIPAVQEQSNVPRQPALGRPFLRLSLYAVFQFRKLVGGDVRKRLQVGDNVGVGRVQEELVETEWRGLIGIYRRRAAYALPELFSRSGRDKRVDESVRPALAASRLHRLDAVTRRISSTPASMLPHWSLPPI